jgi:hypothetical protein
VKKFPKSLKRIAGWLFVFSDATLLFMLMLGLIIRNDWLNDTVDTAKGDWVWPNP